MNTFLFDKVIFGPIQSRRFGTSLGINLLPTDKKICSFDCVYCECGWTDSFFVDKSDFPSIQFVDNRLDEVLKNMHQEHKHLDVITFAGNGEPTLHPYFSEIVDLVIEKRNIYYPQAKITVLTNSTLLHKENIRLALKKIENPILKIDSAVEETFNKINLPKGNIRMQRVLDDLVAFDGRKVLQTLFLRGEHNGVIIDNTTDFEIEKLIEAYRLIKPEKIMIYSIDRATPLCGLEKINPDELNEIANKLKIVGVEIQVAG